MKYTHDAVAEAAQELMPLAEKGDDSALKSGRLKQLYKQIPQLPDEQRAAFGAEVNALRETLSSTLERTKSERPSSKSAIDVTAPFDENVAPEHQPRIRTAQDGSVHPIWQEIDTMLDIYYRMGFTAEPSRTLDDDYHMFASLNFPEDHPARDDYDTFMTEEGLIAPAHTSTMQNRVLKKYAENLTHGLPVAVVIPGRVFRNEDVDVTHEHTFYQLEGVYVDKDINVGHLIATLQAFMSEYFSQDLKAKIQPFYFPFTEPSFEFAIERPQSLRRGDSEADMWLELLGCGMIHPNVLKAADIDPSVYTGFAWGGGIERLIMMKYGIEDIRHFHSAKLEFLRQFS